MQFLNRHTDSILCCTETQALILTHFAHYKMSGAAATEVHVPSIAIVGGGIAGLTLALNLLSLSRSTSSTTPKYTVTVYESAQYVFLLQQA